MKNADDVLLDLNESESDGWQTTYSFNTVLKAMKEYARLAIEEQVLICAEEAVTKDLLHEEEGKSMFVCEQVDKDSIINCRRVELK